jgi:tRNA pseudouridine55 synthase
MGIQHDQPARPLRRCVDGVVLVNKPTGLTSNAVLQRVKRAYRALKAGHTGTLDPLASGLLPVCLGEATKFSLGLLDADKRYRAVLHLGVTTETGDVEGAILKTRDVAADRGQIEHALLAFRGDIMQVPHRYSALKRDGRALYTYARAGEPVAIAPRRVRIHALDIEHWESPLLTVNIHCSKGTYVRSLGEDIGEALGCGAHVSALRRLSVGRFGVEHAIDLEVLEGWSEAERDAALLPVPALVDSFPVIELDDDAAGKFQHGQKIAIEPRTGEPGASVAVRRQGSNAQAGAGFLGVARTEIEEGQWMLVPARLMATHATAE